MATVLDASNNKVKLSNGSVITANVGGWYDGQQYWGGTLSNKGQENSLSSSPTAGKMVSAEVNAASANAQGVSVKDFNSFLGNLSVADIQAPTSIPYTTNANGSYINGLNAEVAKARESLNQTLTERRTEIAPQLAAAKASEAGALSEVKTLTTPFRADLQTSMNESLGVNETLAAQKSLLGELDTLLTEGNDLIRQQKEVTGLSAIRNPRIQKTMDDVAARAGVINAVVSLQNTYLANAYQSIDRSVGAITADRQDQLSYYNTVLNLANRDIVSLTAEDRKIADAQVALLEGDLNRATSTVDYIKQLMVNPDSALTMAQSGVSLNDSVETINQKMATYQYSKEVKDMANQFTSAGGVLVTDPSGIPATQLKSFTDSKGKTYYYKMPKTGTTPVNTADDWLKNWVKNNSTNETKDTKTTDIKSTDKTTEQQPNFSPSGGVGTVYVSPSGGIWQYTNSGWKKIS